MKLYDELTKAKIKVCIVVCYIVSSMSGSFQTHKP